MLETVIKKFINLLRKSPYNNQVVSIVTATVTIASLFSGCEFANGLETPTMPPSPEPSISGGLLPSSTPTYTNSQTPTIDPTQSPTVEPTVEITSTPEPTPEPYVSIFGMTGDEDKTKVIVESDVGFAILEVNGILKIPPIERSFIEQNEKGKDVLYRRDLFKKGLIVTSSLEGDLLEISEDYFKKYNAERLEVKYFGICDFETLLNILKKAGYKNIDEKFFMSIAKGEWTLRDIEEWYKKAIPPMHWPVETKYSMYHKVSDIPQVNDDKPIEYRLTQSGKWNLYFDGELIKVRRVVFKKGNYRDLYLISKVDNKDVLRSIDIFSGEEALTNNEPNIEFFRKYLGIKELNEIKSIELYTLHSIVKEPYIKDGVLMSAFGPMKNAKTVRDIREAIELMPPEHWYVPSKDPVNLHSGIDFNYTYQGGHLKTADEIITERNNANGTNNPEYYNTLKMQLKTFRG